MHSIGRRTVLGGAAAAMLSLSACGGGTGSSSGGGSKDELVLGAGVEPTSFDPGQSREAQFVQYFQPVFDSLVRRMPSGETSGMLATAWEYSNENTRLTLTLRTDVKFTDGTTFDAEAAKTNLDRFRKGDGPLSGNLAAVKSVSTSGSSKVIIDLSTPDPSLVYNLGGPAGLMGSPKQFDSKNVDTQPVGSGPYVLDRSQSTPGSKYVYTANKDYWNKKIQKFDQITLKVITDENARINALRSGQIDGAIGTAKTISQVESAKNLTVNTVSGDWQGLSLFDRDGSKVEALGNVKVRQAINYAINKKAILKNVVLGYGETTSQIFSPSSDAYIKALDDAYEYDVAKAKKLLSEAGYKNGFTLKMPSSSDMDPSISQVVTDQLAAIGIKVVWTSVATAQYQTEQQSGKYPAAFTPFGQQPQAWGNISQLIVKAGAWNVFDSEDTKVDKLLTTITSATDEADAKAAYQDLNTYLVENAWFNPWYRIKQPYYTGPDVTVEMQTGQAVPSIYNFAPAK